MSIIIGVVIGLIIGGVVLLFYHFKDGGGWLEPDKPEYPPEGWSEYKEIRKGKYRIAIDECEGYGSAYFGEKCLIGFSKIKECATRCEEHRLKEEVKKEMAAEYGLERTEAK